MRDGFLNLNKPSGITSFGAVFRVKKLLGVKKAGHTGTLDPQASGVLPICLGRATRFAFRVVQQDKEYIFDLRLGITTTTGDGEGEVLRETRNFRVEEKELERVVKKYQGEIEQVPPMFSAIKYKGKPLYKLARKGITVARRPRKIYISKLEILNYHFPTVKIKITCSKGTYIRALCESIGEELGCGAYQSSLVRTRVGSFELFDALSFEQIEELNRRGRIEEKIYPISHILKLSNNKL